MKFMGQLITFALISHFALTPQYGYASSPVKNEKPQKVAFSLVKILTKELKDHPQEYFSKEELSAKNAVVDKSITNEAVNEIKKKLLDQSYSLSDIKAEIQRNLILEEQNRMIELKSVLVKISPDKMDEFFKMAMKDGVYADDFRYSYTSAYNQMEKLEVLMQMLQGDISMIRSQNAKQIGMMTREELLRQLEKTGTFFNYKNDKFLTVLIIVLTVAAAGFITWGVISATKARHERKKKELNEDFDRQEQQAQEEYAQKVKSLEEVFAERERLREEGYVWQVCATTKTIKSASCSYNYSSYTGEEVCVTHCLKQPQSGIEAMPTTTCTSSFIPNNCFVKNPTEAGYDDGYSSGYNNGYDVGYDDGYDDAYDSAYDRAYDDAWYDGYDDGYSDGFSSGYSDGYADYSTEESKSRRVLSLKDILKGKNGDDDQRALGYKKGFQEGYSYALQLRVGIAQ